MKFVTQQEAIAIDEMFFSECSYSVDQLMELAGQSVAHVVFEHHKEARKVLIVCGPGNNGGDGLVVARHLHFFGMNVEVYVPKVGKSVLLQKLVEQLKMLGIPTTTSFVMKETLDQMCASSDVIVDALFGQSFRTPANDTFQEVIDSMIRSNRPVVSIDVPSGWDVEKGDIAGNGLRPEILVSMAAPKLCSQTFSGIHYLGGRFVPKIVSDRFGLTNPVFPANSLFIRL
ncbi:putative apolipoprotein a binding protein [Blattamonas nauphoetae]|uniref:NAD(P)H-hydrate epimerase n=1 Tax=Blattamonas nauphoetae TaxID=2049346 RepID=A0ABQ9XDY8_9EUKA|nr:putative apolipoprotein a binding protein [Blattamonas nauphoetae]